MVIKSPSDITPSETTSESIYRQRRRFLQQSAALLGSALLPTTPLAAAPRSPYSTDEPLTPLKSITSYNNFYEFGTQKGDPSLRASALETEPWSVSIDGEVAKPTRFTLEDLLNPFSMEERNYRHRCVEGWSMVIPWLGFPLAALIKRVRPTSRAKYVAFTSLYDADRPLPGQQRRLLKWPYQEALRIDEATHPLTLLATGLYGDPLPNQNGAPLRLVVPWKYGFKSIKSIVRITLTEQRPKTTWNEMSDDYGFYANVTREHPEFKWSFNRERRIGELQKRDTLPFNGYAEQVAQLYPNGDPDLNLRRAHRR
ncbi:mononuclear molybdenum enzyme YedY [Solemya pervernicosa gill symbiont]|uniref:Protein-methionine-sulfoxide reductase catalytic subunit MsrP n=2 Tax=Gammaproteobacteria incertae sedis TaxID=118884 RepID=A0A1T2L467_9GAMM|nr:protein-methionine-sulfoxide reductase catalytic subunit MsrP [Candidatus Reidiella endopervernicosa]OOZ39893.1 mononuclear molybdenum enzyme YedY [Solemya pervernicosa gill symbiont]QKQ25783.1 protein-methionine-sulfoxide reductase catalytic subunit MsrP [Candidatus Reidiella endopervernicosa]